MQLSLCDAGAMRPHAPPLCGFDSNIVGCWLGLVLAWQTYLPTAPRRTGYATRALCALMRRRYAALSQLLYRLFGFLLSLCDASAPRPDVPMLRGVD